MNKFKKLREIIDSFRHGQIVYVIKVNEQTLCFPSLDSAIDYVVEYRTKFNVINEITIVKNLLTPIKYE